MEKHYIVMWKDDNWVNWESKIHNDPDSARMHIGRLHNLCYDQIRMYTVEPSMVYNHIPERTIA